MKLPNVGEDIYIPCRWSIDHGETDISGGLAKVKRIEKYNKSNIFIHVHEVPNAFNWFHICDKQKEYKKIYKKKRACHDPDWGG